jgi:formylglycine-generating enzyme required for sulfatase activity
MDNSGGTTHPVAQRLPNAWDVFDLCGNVGEYTSEWSGPVPTLYSPEPVTDPWGPPNGDPNGWVVFRGDHYLIGPAPTYLPPGAVLPTLMGLNHLGVRLVRTMVEGQGRDR